MIHSPVQVSHQFGGVELLYMPSVFAPPAGDFAFVAIQKASYELYTKDCT